MRFSYDPDGIVELQNLQRCTHAYGSRPGGWEGPAAVSLMHRFLTGLTARLCRASRLRELSYVKQNYSWRPTLMARTRRNSPRLIQRECLALPHRDVPPEG